MTKRLGFFYYFFFYGCSAFLLPYFVLYYQSIGFSGTQIGLLTMTAPLISMVGAPLWTAVADSTRRHRLVMTLCALIGLVGAVALFPLVTTFLPVLILVALYSFFGNPVISFADSASVHMLGGEADKYGQLRLGGTISWGIVAPLAGWLIEKYGLNIGFWSYAALMLLPVLISQRFTFSTASAGSSLRRGISVIFRNPRYVIFLAIAMLGGFAFSPINNYLFPFMKEVGAGEGLMGISLTVSVLSEIPILFFANRLLGWLKPRGMLALGLVSTGIRLLLCWAFPTPGAMVAAQILNGLTLPVVLVACISYNNLTAPEGVKATGQGLVSAMVYGIGFSIGGLLGGLLLDSLGGRGLFLVFGLITLIGFWPLKLGNW